MARSLTFTEVRWDQLWGDYLPSAGGELWTGDGCGAWCWRANTLQTMCFCSGMMNLRGIWIRADAWFFKYPPNIYYIVFVTSHVAAVSVKSHHSTSVFATSQLMWWKVFPSPNLRVYSFLHKSKNTSSECLYDDLLIFFFFLHFTFPTWYSKTHLKTGRWKLCQVSIPDVSIPDDNTFPVITVSSLFRCNNFTYNNNNYWNFVYIVWPVNVRKRKEFPPHFCETCLFQINKCKTFFCDIYL